MRQKALSEVDDTQSWGKMVALIAAKAENHFRSFSKATPDEVANSGLTRILGVIDGLIDKFTIEQGQNEKEEAENKQAFEDLKSKLEPQIASAKTRKETLTSRKATLSQKISDTDSQIRQDKQTKILKTEELNDEQAACDAAEKKYKEDTERRTEDLKVLNRVLEIFQNDLSNLSERNEKFIKDTKITV